jgi:hypothetical protein
VSGQHSANSVEYCPDIGQEGDSVPTVTELVEDFADLSVIITILHENVPQECQLRRQVVS